MRRRATERAPSSRRAHPQNSMNDALWPEACAVLNSWRLPKQQVHPGGLYCCVARRLLGASLVRVAEREGVCPVVSELHDVVAVLNGRGSERGRGLTRAVDDQGAAALRSAAVFGPLKGERLRGTTGVVSHQERNAAIILGQRLE